MKEEHTSALKWWNSKRKKYNFGLIISGIFSFILYLLVVELIVLKSEKNWDGEITIFTILIQGIGFLIMILLANIFYFLGPVMEKILDPRKKEEFRKIAFDLGYWFSFCLPI